MKSTNNTSSQSSANSPVVNSYASSSAAAGASSMQAQSTAGTKKGQQVKNVIGVFSSHDSAEKAVAELRKSGFNTEEINVISKEGKGSQQGGEFYDDDITDGTLTGGTLGGLGGLLLGAGALAIPGIGPVLAAGPIAGAIGGAVAGGITGGLIDWGIPAESSERYERSVEEGNILAIIRADSAKVNQAAQVLRQNGARDVESHNAR
ncbi:MAG: general stress protein [Pelosinus sp.]|nr:general stress protein [Pelosinus sp.]